MTDRDQRIARLLSIPPDYRWDELVLVLEEAGFSLAPGAGARRALVSKGRKVFVQRPQPGCNVKRYMLRQVIEVLRSTGAISGT